MKRDATPAFVKPRKADPDQLKAITNGLKQLRDARQDIGDTEQRLKEKKVAVEILERNTLPALFNKAGISNLGLDPEGNMPGYDAKREPYVHANIAANWPPEKRDKAFAFLEANGGGSLIKTEVVILLPRDSAKQRKALLAALKKLKLQPEINLAVPWASLSAFIREYIENHKKMPPLDVLGADVGEVVRLKQRKAE